MCTRDIPLHFADFRNRSCTCAPLLCTLNVEFTVLERLWLVRTLT